jgi:hypothetical protein
MTDKNEVATVFGGAVKLKGNSAALAQAMAQSAAEDPRNNVDGDYLNFSGKSGRFVIGKDARNIEDDELWVANIAGFESGWVCWKGSKPVATRMASIQGIPVAEPDKNQHAPFGEGEGWFQAKAMSLKSLDTNQQGYMRLNSISGVSAISEFQKLIAARMVAGEPAWPVFSLSSEAFKSQSYSNYKPVFDVVGWLSDEHVESAFADGADLKKLMLASASGDDEDDADELPPPKRRRV